MEAITILGLVAASLTTACFVPQAIKIIRSKETKNISLLMYICLCTGVVLWFVYGLILKNAPLMMANSISLLLSATILGYKIKYK